MKSGSIDFEDGIIYVTTGGGGAEPHYFGGKKPDYIATGLVVNHYIMVNVVGGHLAMMVYDIDGRLIDLLTLTK